MTKEVYRYSFITEAPIEEVEASLLLAVMVLDAIVGS